MQLACCQMTCGLLSRDQANTAANSLVDAPQSDPAECRKRLATLRERKFVLRRLLLVPAAVDAAPALMAFDRVDDRSRALLAGAVSIQAVGVMLNYGR